MPQHLHTKARSFLKPGSLTHRWLLCWEKDITVSTKCGTWTESSKRWCFQIYYNCNYWCKQAIVKQDKCMRGFLFVCLFWNGCGKTEWTQKRRDGSDGCTISATADAFLLGLQIPERLGEMPPCKDTTFYSQEFYNSYNLSALKLPSQEPTS